MDTKHATAVARAAEPGTERATSAASWVFDDSTDAATCPTVFANIADENTRSRLLRAIREPSGMDNDQIVEAGEHGADAGWPGFTYTADAADFYNANADDIWQLLNESTDDLGSPSPLALLASFQRADMATDAATFGNLLAWYALEEIGRWLVGES